MVNGAASRWRPWTSSDYGLAPGTFPCDGGGGADKTKVNRGGQGFFITADPL